MNNLKSLSVYSFNLCDNFYDKNFLFYIIPQPFHHKNPVWSILGLHIWEGRMT